MSILSIEKLISEVEKQPCVWNMHHDNYSDKPEKLKAWRKICRVFYPQSEENTADEATKIAFLQKKWKSVRDYYIKQKKYTNDRFFRIKKRKYIYFDMLQFLETNLDRSKSTNHKYDHDESSTTAVEVIADDSLDSEEAVIKTEMFDEYEEAELEEQEHLVVETTERRREEIDEDEMFLKSLLPSIRKLTPLQKMDFKLEVMSSLRKIQFSK